MRIINASVFVDGNFVKGGVDFDERIAAAGKMVTGDGYDAEGCLIIPGLVDIHTHGAMGADASDGDGEGMQTLSRYYAAAGVTSWCPTTMTLKEPELKRAMQTIRDFKRPADGARVAGIHMEGPFVSLNKRGAQSAENLHLPDMEMFRRLNEASGGMIRLITVAPELKGAMDFIRDASSYCSVSLGHTEADYRTAMAAYSAGANQITHLFNAMPPLMHRDPGVIAAAADSGAAAELITDGFHVHPAVIRLACSIFKDRVILISDSLRCAGMPDGEYTLGGQSITMTDSKVVLKDTDTLAGSSISLLEGLRRAVSFGIPLEDAIAAATIAPARAIGMEGRIGTLEPGKLADFVILDRELKVKTVFIGGKAVNIL